MTENNGERDRFMRDAKDKLIEELLRKLKRAEEKNKHYENLLADRHATGSVSDDKEQPDEEKQNTARLKTAEKAPEENNGSSDMERKMDHVQMEIIGAEQIQLFRSVFRGRTEFYARRTKHSTYLRPCYNRYSREGICPKQQGKSVPCKNCKHQNFVPLNDDAVRNHLLGNREDCSDVIGIYPITSRNTCWFIVFDFDDKNHRNIAQNAAHADTVTGNDSSFWWDVRALTDICRIYSVPCLIERSRSRLGAHVWVFFDEEIPCADARRFGNSLLTEGMKSVNVTEFHTYDRMLPMQDSLETGQAGNLIALPFQGKAVSRGGSIFLNETFRPFSKQWDVLRNLKRYTKEELYRRLDEWNLQDPYGECSPLFDEDGSDRPWEIHKKDLSESDIQGKAEIVLSDGVYVRSDVMKPRLKNRIRRLALYKNPEYFKAKKRNMEISSLKTPYYVYCGRDIGNWIRLPRGCADSLIEAMQKGCIPYEVTDERSSGRSVHVSFKGVLKDNQNQALDSLRNQPDGIISAATAFGKTVVGSALIAERKTSTLIIVNRSEIMDGWFETFEDFLEVSEELPVYTTPKGRVKTRSSIIGRYGGGHHELNGIIDIAMVQSLVRNGEVKGELLQTIENYGLVIADECHHVGGEDFQELLNHVKAKYVYGFTATPKRYDSQDKKMYFQLGRIRYRFSAKDRAQEQNIDHLVYPRFTSLISPDENTKDYNKMLKYLTPDAARNQMISEDVIDCVRNKRTPLILTKRVEQAKILYELLKEKADHVLLMAGKLKASELNAIKEERQKITDAETLIMIATGSRAGEGFNYPRLDTLMLAAPVSWEGSIEQYAGRLNRDYPNKKNVIVYDYVDAAVPMFDYMYRMRLKTYHMIGFEVCAAVEENRIRKNCIYYGTSFRSSFFSDLNGIQDQAVIFSPYLSGETISALWGAVNETLRKGVLIRIITISPKLMDQEYSEGQNRKIAFLRSHGFQVTESSQKNMNLSYALLDRRIIWYGCQNILGNCDEDDEIIRFEDSLAASSLLNAGFKRAGILEEREYVLQTRLAL